MRVTTGLLFTFICGLALLVKYQVHIHLDVSYHYWVQFQGICINRGQACLYNIVDSYKPY